MHKCADRAPCGLMRMPCFSYLCPPLLSRHIPQIPYWINNIEGDAIQSGKSVLVASSENAIRGLLMHLLNIPKEQIVNIEIPTGLPLVFDLRHKCLKLLEGDFTEYNFGTVCCGATLSLFILSIDAQTLIYSKQSTNRTGSSITLWCPM